MSFRSNMSRLERSNLLNKSDKELKKIFIEHYDILGKPVSKDVEDGIFPSRIINKIKKDLLKSYKKEVKREDKINKNYNAARDKYNRKVDKVLNQYKEGRTELEYKYISGEEVFIPKLMYDSTHNDKFSLNKIGYAYFSNLSHKETFTKKIKEKMKRLDKLDNSDFYNTEYNLELIEVAIEGARMNNRLSETHFDLLREKIGTLTEFELEMLAKMHLEKLIEIYLGVGAEELTEEKAEKFFEHIYEGMYNVMSTNRDGQYSYY